MEKCMICHFEAVEGLQILENTICIHCEEELVHTQLNDPFFLLFVDKLKAMKLV